MIDFIEGLIVLLNVRHIFSSFGTKISHVSFFHSNSRNNVLSTTKIATHRRLTKGVRTWL